MRRAFLLRGLLLMVPTVALAAATSPTLVLSAATGGGGAGAHTVVLEGAFEYDNALQVGYPLEVVVFQKTHFVRFPITGGAVTGTSPALNDGVLAEAELPAFLTAGSPATVTVRIVTMAPGALRLTLPAAFKSGAATAMLFTILPKGTVLSNQLDFVLP